jgi:F0F1-type ATP synthase membrane subunit c/vacuolar-type H+-ATPase subunit K
MSDISVSIAIGAAFGTGKAGIGIAGLGSFRPELVMKVSPHIHIHLFAHFWALISVSNSSGHVWNHRCLRSCGQRANSWQPYVLLLEICIEAILNFHIVDPAIDYPLYKGFVHLGAGVACGMTGLAAGYAIGHVGDAVRLLLLRSYSNADVSLRSSAYEPMSRNRKSSSLWFLSSSLRRSWAYMGVWHSHS